VNGSSDRPGLTLTRIRGVMLYIALKAGAVARKNHAFYINLVFFTLFDLHDSLSLSPGPGPEFFCTLVVEAFLCKACDYYYQ
jgi:hypothetical protein